MNKLRELKLKKCWHCDNDRYLQTDKSFMLVCSNCGTYYSDRNDPELFTRPGGELEREVEKLKDRIENNKTFIKSLQSIATKLEKEKDFEIEKLEKECSELKAENKLLKDERDGLRLISQSIRDCFNRKTKENQELKAKNGDMKKRVEKIDRVLDLDYPDDSIIQMRIAIRNIIQTEEK